MPIGLVRRDVARIALAAPRLVPVAHVRAQSAPTLAPGARVRLSIRDAYPGRVSGTLVALGDDTLRFTPDGDSTALVVRLDRLTRLDVSRGIHRHTLQDFVTGAVIGAFTGFIVGYASGDDPKQEFLSFSRGDKAAILGAGFGVIGGGIGTIVGFARRSEVWQPVARPYTVTIAPQRGGMTLAMRVAF